MIYLYTDFSLHGPYLGQMTAAALEAGGGVPVVNLMADVSRFDIESGAYLLAALARQMRPGDVVVGVVDPGVGTDSRGPVVLEADGVTFVGPGNGLFDVVAKRAATAAWSDILWRPAALSASFHGRDLFAPVAGRLAAGGEVPRRRMERDVTAVADDLHKVIYIDHYGNVMSGIRACSVGDDRVIGLGGVAAGRARVFGEVAVGACFWYENSLGLVEVAVNRGSAAQVTGVAVGAAVRVLRAG